MATASSLSSFSILESQAGAVAGGSEEVATSLLNAYARREEGKQYIWQGSEE